MIGGGWWWCSRGAAIGDASSRGFVFDRARRGRAGSIFTLCPAFDHEGVRVGKLDAHILLVDAWQFAVEFVGVFDLADIELRLEGADARGGFGAAPAWLGAVDVVIIEEAEEGTEIRGGEGWEE